MEGVRRRKPAAGGDNTLEKESGGDGTGRTLHSYVMLLTTVLLLSSCLLVWLLPDHPLATLIISGVDRSALLLSLTTPVYSVVLDAGSTGSRVLAFSFYHNPVTGNLVLQDELWHEIKPGLSSFASSPSSGADTITELLALALERVPQEKRSSVPVTLKATAGLRLLPEEQSTALIAAVQERLEKSGFDNRGVGILSELDEGVFGWVTVNYLLDQLHNPTKSYVALDLGGGSTQITFLPKYEETLKEAPASFLHEITVLGTTHKVYSHSYLGLGLMAAREKIFSHNQDKESLSLTSPCMVTSKPTQWNFHGKQYSIRRTSSLAGYESCMVTVQAVIDSMKVDQRKEVPTRKIAAFSYFYDRAVDAGLIRAGESGLVTVQDYLEAARTACSTSDQAQEFLCVDLSFIAGLLHHGYRLAPQAKLGVYKEIDGHQTSWALGAAFNMLDLA